LERSPRTVLDLGCGEGWLSRALSSHGVRVTGVDFSLPLACAARAVVATYDALPFACSFDTIVANFSLLDDRLPPLPPHTRFIIQTLHPGAAAEDGWRTADVAGWSEPMPWYSRTMESWLRSLNERYAKVEVREPQWPDGRGAASVIFVCG
ncbi:MAG TPA: class I SAM-dependent methyltransferase, partial [Thermoanaerobaculia bacterium]|nr:class I SAM-dependent methyltransferase [Thermoanaerobaculia bacterium]